MLTSIAIRYLSGAAVIAMALLRCSVPPTEPHKALSNRNPFIVDETAEAALVEACLFVTVVAVGGNERVLEARVRNTCGTAMAILTTPLVVRIIDDPAEPLPASYLRTSVAAHLVIQQFDPEISPKFVGSVGGEFHSDPGYYVLQANEIVSVPIIGSQKILESLSSGKWLATIHTFGVPAALSDPRADPFLVTERSKRNWNETEVVVLSRNSTPVQSEGHTFEIDETDVMR